MPPATTGAAGVSKGSADGRNSCHTWRTSRLSPYESASPGGPIMPVSCGNRRPGRSLTAKVTAKWLRASYAESRFGADELVANDHEPTVHVLDQDELLAANDHSATTVSLTYLHAERVALLEAFDGHEFMLDSA
jgi:hypothetical protein